MPRTNKTRFIEWHETCKCDCIFGVNVCNNKKRWNKNKCRCECKELIDKGVCNKGCIWNPSNYSCECDKACGVGEYLDYENCKCRKKLVDKLVDECTETVDEVKLAKITLDENQNSYKCRSCTVYTVLFWIFFTITVGGICGYFVYFHGYLKKVFTRETTIYQTYEMGEFKQISIENRTLYFYNDQINLKDFDARLLKVDKKITKRLTFITSVM